MSVIVEDYANREKWVEERGRGIGSSDVAAVLGVSPFKSNVNLWDEKMGLKEPEDISDLDYVRSGTESEAPLRILFGVDYPQYEIDYKENRILINSKYNFIRCSPDSLLIEKETGRKGFLEIKRAEIRNSAQFDQWKNGRIPEHYYTQTLQYFLVDEEIEFGYLRVYLIRYLRDGVVVREIRDYLIANSRKEKQADLDYLFAKELEFWNCIQNGTRPAKILPNI